MVSNSIWEELAKFSLSVLELGLQAVKLALEKEKE
jgi:hypothetical protein